MSKPTLTPSRPPCSSSSIELRGVRVHNLKNLDLDIPLNQLVVITGVSGSGKSSLAFDTLFLEGQRQYIESFSTSDRRHLERIERPTADRMSHIPVAIAVQNDRGRKQRMTDRSTVAMLADVTDGFKQLFSRLGQIVCPRCGTIVKAHSAQDVVHSISRLSNGTRCQLVFVALHESDAKTKWLKKGFGRAIWDGSTRDLNSTASWPESTDVWLVADRLIAGKTSPERIAESVETAFAEGNGRCHLMIETTPDDIKSISIDGRHWKIVRFSRHWECAECHRQFLPPEPRLFSHIQSGACSTCSGTGLSSVESNPRNACDACHGTRLREETRAVKIHDKSIADVMAFTPLRALEYVSQLGEVLGRDELKLTDLVRRDVENRLTIICDLGFRYLTLDRSANTLSGGESRRLKLASILGARITGTMIVIDEPSDGLTEAESPNVIQALRQLQTMKNSVIVVDHSPLVVAAADHVIELGPGAGPTGGNIVYQGLPSQDFIPIEKSANSKTISSTTTVAKETLHLDQVDHHHFHNAQFHFPLNQLCVVTGPSGSGKTSLVTQVLYPAVSQQLARSVDIPLVGSCVLSGGKKLSDVVLIDQSPLSKSSRSNPATWLDLFDEIRQIFATTNDARQRGFTAQQFSFNSSSGGRCRGCLGTGILKQNMQFLPDMTLPCPECGGSRYRKEILEVKYRGRSIADVLQMSVSEAAAFFRSQPRIQARFQMLKQMGLDYLVLGQPSETLSGGEAQRLKLAAMMMTPNASPGLIICDDPTTGLHPKDVRQLIGCFRELINNGHSLIVADNSPELISAADNVVQLPPPRIT